MSVDTAYIAGLIDSRGSFVIRQGTPLYIFGTTCYDTASLLSKEFGPPIYKHPRLTSNKRVYYQVTFTPTPLRSLLQNPYIAIKRLEAAAASVQLNCLLPEQQPLEGRSATKYLAAVFDICGHLEVNNYGRIVSLAIQSKDAQFLNLLYNILLDKKVDSKIYGNRLKISKNETLKMLSVIKEDVHARKDMVRLLLNIRDRDNLYDITHEERIKLGILRRRNIGFLS